MEIIRLEDQNELVPCKSFPAYASFPFENFNPVQSRIFDIFAEDANVLIASSTSSGKTLMAEMFMANEIRERGKKAVYLAPLKALAQEKIDDWTDPSHHFSDLNLSICTGDYRLTPERRKELEAADIIVMTTEMLSSRCRNFNSENNEWLKDIGTLVSDEFHLVGVQSRGSHAEVGLMKFCDLVPDIRLVCLSATMPNVDQLAEWVGQLTGKKTYLIESDYRPCPLAIHYEQYYDYGRYDDVERAKVETALEIIDDYPDDKFLIFVHTKRTGKIMKEELGKVGIECEYHNADLDKAKRSSVETRFKEDPKLRAIVATSTLAYGVNLPARRVIILGVHRGLNEVEVFDIIQEVGRAGRPYYDTRGDAYILVPQRKAEEHIERIRTPQDVESRLLDYIGDEDRPHYKTLAFHIVSEIHHGSITTKEDVYNWFNKTLASFQANDIDDEIIDLTLDLLKRFGAVKEEDGKYQATIVGKVSSLFYYSPFDVADLRKNFNFLFEQGREGDDTALSICLGNIDSIRSGFVSNAEREDMGSYAFKVRAIFGSSFNDIAIKGGYAHWLLLKGLHSDPFSALSRSVQFDFPRTLAVLNCLDSMGGRWNRKEWFRELQMRISYGVSSEKIHLCKLPEIGKVRTEKLWAAGLKTYDAIADRPTHVQKVLNMKEDRVKKICEAAKALTPTG